MNIEWFYLSTFLPGIAYEITFDPSYSLSQRLIHLRWKLI